MQYKTFIFAALATASLGAPVAASAQSWQSINQRQSNLDSRIDQGVRNGALNRAEATRLRNDFRALARLEADYRRSGRGFTVSEHADLDRRFDRLSQRVYVQKRDRQVRR